MAKQRTQALQGKPSAASSQAFSVRHRMDIIAVAILYVLTLFLFRGIVFDNAVFSTQGDTAAALSWSEAGRYLQDTEHVPILWMPYIFSGMPAFGSLSYVSTNVDFIGVIMRFVLSLFFFNVTMAWMVQAFFFGGVSTYVFLRALKQPPVAAAIGALIFMFNPIAVGLAQAGHGSKLLALMDLPAVMLATWYLFERRSLVSLGLFAAAIGTLLLANHVQIAYYIFLLIGCYWLTHVILDVRRQPKTVLKQSAMFWGGIILGLCISAFVYLSVYEYSKFSMRGGSGMPGAGGGLTLDYATSWSFHPLELLTYAVPSFFGFQSPYYWGWMPFTESTKYMGLLPILLTIIALLYRRNRVTIFFAIVGVLAFFVSFGKFSPLVYDLLFKYLPFFNKFRAPDMILSITPFIAAVLSAYGMSFLLTLFDKGSTVDAAKLAKRTIVVLAVIIGATILAAIVKDSLFQTLSGSMFLKDGDAQQYTAQQISQLKEMRFDLLWKDVVKGAIISAVLLGALVLYFRKTIGKGVLAAVVGLTFVIDIFIMDANYVTPQQRDTAESRFAPDATVMFLRTDTAQYRVFPLGQLFGDNTWMYHRIQSIGGYSAAKLQIYQDMIDSTLYHGWDPEFPLNMNVVDMLNVKYLIAPGRLPDSLFTLVSADRAKRILTYRNPRALPRVFFVDSVIVAKNRSEVFRMLNSPSFNPARDAILEEAPSLQPGRSDSVSITPVSVHSQDMSYRVTAHAPALLVFSEVYYPAGWKASIDGAATPIYKTDYLLRSIVVPSGSHTVDMKFEPPLYSLGYAISLGAWCAVLLIIGGGCFMEYRRRNKVEKPESGPHAQ